MFYYLQRLLVSYLAMNVVLSRAEREPENELSPIRLDDLDQPVRPMSYSDIGSADFKPRNDYEKMVYDALHSEPDPDPSVCPDLAHEDDCLDSNTDSHVAHPPSRKPIDFRVTPLCEAQVVETKRFLVAHDSQQPCEKHIDFKEKMLTECFQETLAFFQAFRKTDFDNMRALQFQCFHDSVLRDAFENLQDLSISRQRLLATEISSLLGRALLTLGSNHRDITALYADMLIAITKQFPDDRNIVETSFSIGIDLADFQRLTIQQEKEYLYLLKRYVNSVANGDAIETEAQQLYAKLLPKSWLFQKIYEFTEAITDDMRILYKHTNQETLYAIMASTLFLMLAMNYKMALRCSQRLMQSYGRVNFFVGHAGQESRVSQRAEATSVQAARVESGDSHQDAAMSDGDASDGELEFTEQIQVTL